MYKDYYSMYNQYYAFNRGNYRNDDSQLMEQEELITFSQAVELIRKSIEDEKEDELFYNKLIEQAPTEDDKNIIKSIREDEIKHNQILRDLYYQITGQIVPVNNLSTASNDNMNYKENLQKALFGELEAVKKYRKVLSQMPSGESYTLIMSIMTDELTHANKYNFLISNVH